MQRTTDTRTANHTGSIRKRSDRRLIWQAQVLLENGKRLTRSFAYKNEAVKWVREQMTELANGTSSELVSKYLKDAMLEWLDKKEADWKPRTAQQNRNVVEKHILPRIKSRLRVADVKPVHVEAIIEQARKDHLGARTIDYMHSMIYSFYQYLIDMQLASRNPAAPVKVKYKSPRMQILEQAEVRRFLASIQGEWLEFFFYLAIHTGMREGELFGLRWSDVKLLQAAISVQTQIQWLYDPDRPETQSRYVFQSVKTDGSDRRVAIGPAAVERLLAQQRRLTVQRLVMGDKWDELDLVFPNNLGRPLEPSNVSRSLHRFLKRAGVKRVRIQDLRHTCASLMLLANIHPKIVQERLGHSDIRITLQLYSHLLPTLQTEAAATLDVLMDPAGGMNGTFLQSKEVVMAAFEEMLK